MSKGYLAVAAAAFALATVFALMLGAMVAYERVSSHADLEQEPPLAQVSDRGTWRKDVPRT